MNVAVLDHVESALTAAALIAFEDEIADLFAAGKVRSPIHLAGGNERALIEIFKCIDVKNDYVLCGWRSHLHCLLKGVPRDKLIDEIVAGRSVSLCFPEHKIFCSGIVGGIAPIAVGLAWAEKQKADASPYGQCAKVHCFLGDMSAYAGTVSEAMRYALGHDLPVHWIIEDNGKSVCTPTEESWGTPWQQPPYSRWSPVTRYRYELNKPHAGIGRWVNFNG